jgi:hypothetical protein
VHEHQHVQGLEEHRFDGEEVARDDTFGLRGKELYTPLIVTSVAWFSW